MRPTIPLASWRIAVDLSATDALATHVGDPPCGRRCPMCRNWAAAVHGVLPTALQAQLRRLGVEPARPSELYGGGVAPGLYRYRVTYHTAGRILGGPPAVVEDPEFGAVRSYEALREDPPLGLSVTYAHRVHGDVGWRRGGTSLALEVDFRLVAPWVLSEPGPADFIPPPEDDWRGKPWARAYLRTRSRRRGRATP